MRMLKNSYIIHPDCTLSKVGAKSVILYKTIGYPPN